MINNETIQYPFSSADMQMRVTYTAGGDPEYIGQARPGALTSAAEWQIKKCAYDGDGNLTSVLFAGGVNDYIKIWDSRAGYTYA